MMNTIFLNKDFWDSVNSQLLSKVQNDSKFRNGIKAVQLKTVSDYFEDLTDTYLPDLIRAHIKDYLPATGVRDLHDSSFYDTNGSFIGLNTKARNMAVDVMGGCKIKRLFEFLSESENNHYIFLDYECIQSSGQKWWIKEINALPMTFLPINTLSFTMGGWGQLMVRIRTHTEQRDCADGRPDKRGRHHGQDVVYGANWDNPPTREEWLSEFRDWIIKNYENQKGLLQKKIDLFEEMSLTQG